MGTGTTDCALLEAGLAVLGDQALIVKAIYELRWPSGATPAVYADVRGLDFADERELSLGLVQWLRQFADAEAIVLFEMSQLYPTEVERDWHRVDGSGEGDPMTPLERLSRSASLRACLGKSSILYFGLDPQRFRSAFERLAELQLQWLPRGDLSLEGHRSLGKAN